LRIVAFRSFKASFRGAFSVFRHRSFGPQISNRRDRADRSLLFLGFHRRLAGIACIRQVDGDIFDNPFLVEKRTFHGCSLNAIPRLFSLRSTRVHN